MTWTVKPPVSTPLDTGHSLYTGLQVCIPLLEGSGTSLYDPKRAVSYTLPSSSMWETSRNLLINADTEYFEVTFDATSLDDFTFVVGGYDFNGGAGVNRTFFSSSNLSQFRLYSSYSRINLLSYNGDNRFESISWSEVSDSAPHNIFCVGKFSTPAATLYFDGSTTNYAMTLTGVPNITTSTGFYVGGRPSSTGYHMDGEFSYFYLYNRQLTTSEIDSLHTNPWQIFLDSGGGFVVSDGANASESLGSTAHFIGTLSDGASSSESNTKLAGLLANFADSASSGDVSIGLAGYYGENSEAVTSYDNITSLAGYLSTLADGTKITDYLVTAIIASLADGVHVVDEQTAKASFTVNLTDTSILSETLTAIRALVGALSDGSAITDITTGYSQATDVMTMTITIKSGSIGINLRNIANITFQEG